MVTLDSVDLAELVNLPGIQKIANKSLPETFKAMPHSLAQSHAPFLVFYGGSYHDQLTQ